MVYSSNLVATAILATALLAAGIPPAAAESEAIRLSEPVERSSDSETFGSPLDETLPSVSLQQLAADAESHTGKPFRVTVRVARVCQKKGCFFIAQDGDTVMRVSFADYSFFLPTDIGGKRVDMVGELVARELTPEQAEHYAADLGETSATLQPGKVWELVATSVRVPLG